MTHADARRPPRHRARQSRPRRLHQALRSRRLSQRDHGRGCARAARSSRSAARRCHGLFHGRADHGLPGAVASGQGALGRARRSRHPPRRRRRAAGHDRGRARSAVARRRLRSDRPICFAPSPSRPNPTCGRSPLACAARARRSAAPKSGASRCRSWSRSAARTRSPARRKQLAALIPGAQALAIPGRDHMLAVGDKVFKCRRCFGRSCAKTVRLEKVSDDRLI